VDRTKTFSSLAAAATVVASLAMVASTSALAACKTTLRGELVPTQELPWYTFQGKFLFFSLIELTTANRTDSEKDFQSLVVPNTRTSFPVPFALDIDSPKDCPSEFELRVIVHATNPPPKFTYGGELRGRKKISIDKFETIPLWGGSF
jgi:hypothetical protein